jgi:stearoyl-CoA desaturase (delta-9 desaturase)
MSKLNWYFWKIYLPIQLISIIAIAFALYSNTIIYWWTVLIIWFLIGPLGVGVGFHRLFSHRQFKTYRPLEYILALLGTLSTYGPVLYWVAEHQHHHKHVDTEHDINNPKHGFWHSFLYWRFTKKSLDAVLIKNRCSIIAMNDKMLLWMSNYFALIVYTYLVVSLLFGLPIFISVFVLPVFIEQIRLNVLNSIVHMKIPGSYQNFPNEDSSYNNILIGYLTFGFGWHNNHHHNPRELVNSHRWYEIDIEGLIGKLLSKN